MKAYLIINHYLKNKKFNELVNLFLLSSKKYNLDLIVKDNLEMSKLILSNNIEKVDFILFWDKDVHLARELEILGFKVYNSSESIKICDDKSLTYLNLLNKNIPMPKTLISPLTFNFDISSDNDFYDIILGNFDFPFIIKECFGSFGEQVYLIKDENELKNKLIELKNKRFIVQEFIKESFGKDIRIEVIGGEIILSVMRINEKDFRANLTNGGKCYEYSPTKEEKDLALKVCKNFNLHFAGVDILFGKNGPIFCEVNSNAHFKNISDFGNINVSDIIIKYLIDINK